MLPLTAIDAILNRFPDHVLISFPSLGGEELQIDGGHLRAQVQLNSELPVFVVTVRETGKLVTWGEAATPYAAFTGALETIHILLSARAQAA